MHAELIPVHSPLLRESYLVSFPPLTYMLKFSGFSDLTSCLCWDAFTAVDAAPFAQTDHNTIASERNQMSSRGAGYTTRVTGTSAPWRAETHNGTRPAVNENE